MTEGDTSPQLRGGSCPFLFLRNTYDRTGQYVAPKTKRAMSNAEKDAVRARNVARTKERKDARREAQELMRQANVVRRHMGTLTPWEQACRLRATRRQACRNGVALAA